MTFVLSGLIVLTIAIPPVELSEDREAHGALDIRAPLHDMVDGFRFVLGFWCRATNGDRHGYRSVWRWRTVCLGQPFSTEVLNAGDSGYGVIVTALGVGVALGMAAITLWGRTVQRREPLFGFALCSSSGCRSPSPPGRPLLPAPPHGSSWQVSGTGVAYVTGFTHLHAVVTDEIRGRTFAALFSFARAALLVSFALSGIGSAAMSGVLPGLFSNGVRGVMLVSGATILLTGLGVTWAVRVSSWVSP